MKSSFHEYFEWLHSFHCFWNFILSTVSRVFAHYLHVWFIFEILKNSTKFRIMFLMSYACFANNFVMTINCFIHCVLYDEKKSWNRVACEIFCDYHFLNAQFMFYFLTVCYEIHIKLAHINFCWIEKIAYHVIYDEMFVRNFLIHVCSNLDKMFCNDIIFCNLWFYSD